MLNKVNVKISINLVHLTTGDSIVSPIVESLENLCIVVYKTYDLRDNDAIFFSFLYLV